ncbi:MAG: hypothetical protein ACP5NW_05920 [Candidatus Woesearchaeota archaeon]
MSHVFIAPEWFFGYDIALEFIFAVVTMLVSYYAWKIHKATDERNIRLFSLAFLFISISYIVQCVLNLIILDHLEDEVVGLVNLQSIYHLSLFGLYFHAILFLIGILLLTYIALKIYSLQTFILLFLLVFSSLYFSPYKTFMLYLLSTVLLGFIVYYYVVNYWKNRKKTTLLVMIAMILLFASYLHFMFAMENPVCYVLGHVLELFAYLLVLANLLMILRVGKQGLKNGKKTR